MLTHDANGNRTAIQPRLPADFDHSGAVDPADLAVWSGCKTGPNVPLDAAAPDFDDCVAADLDADNDVDLGDFALMQPYLISGFAPPPATTYAYNYRNQLVEATLPTGQRHEYRYDVLGRRVGKILDADGTPQRTAYFYDGSRVIEERGESGTEATYVFGLYVDEVLSIRRAIGGSTPDFYFFTDDQYSVTAVTAPDGDVVERYTYDDFGALTILDPAGQPRSESAIGNPYTYTGRRYDAEVGLYYYRTRHLDPATGRFTSRDSIGLWGDPLNLGNAYTYVGNNPWTFVDPYGSQAAILPLVRRGGQQGPPPQQDPEAQRWAAHRARMGVFQAEAGIVGAFLTATGGVDNYWDQHADTIAMYSGGVGLVAGGAAIAPTVVPAILADPAVQAALMKLSWRAAQLGILGIEFMMPPGGPSVCPGGIAGSSGSRGAVDATLDAAGKALDTVTEGHHPWPQYLGGPVKQALARLPKQLHTLYHSGLDRLLPRQYSTEYYRRLSGNEQAANFEKLRVYTEAFDKQHLTNLWEAIKKIASGSE